MECCLHFKCLDIKIMVIKCLIDESNQPLNFLTPNKLVKSHHCIFALLFLLHCTVPCSNTLGVMTCKPYYGCSLKILLVSSYMTVTCPVSRPGRSWQAEQTVMAWRILSNIVRCLLNQSHSKLHSKVESHGIKVCIQIGIFLALNM